MGTQALKNRIESYLEQADEHILNIVNSVFENYYQDEHVAFHPDGKPMTRNEYNEALKIAEEQIENQDYISVEDFEEE